MWWLDQAEIEVATNDIGHRIFAAAGLNPGQYTVVDGSDQFVVRADPND